jgi:Ca2+-transporting ATPase
MALTMSLGSLAVFYHYFSYDLAKAQTMTLLTMAMFQWFNAWNCRSEKLSLFKIGLFTNKWLIGAMIFVLSLQILLIYTPWLQSIFKTVPLIMDEWAIICAISFPIILLEEMRKFFVRRRDAQVH